MQASFGMAINPTNKGPDRVSWYGPDRVDPGFQFFDDPDVDQPPGTAGAEHQGNGFLLLPVMRAVGWRHDFSLR